MKKEMDVKKTYFYVGVFLNVGILNVREFIGVFKEL
ncbi:hypothetical protein GGR08_001568 [Bartonella fuyuanensis]|uniref:Uncharacterized protein n=1 Tax=Bartonella fuyuanensis TaxID=1460968 RepID=A0A840DWC5_9HYPH|nr:hypothetical protein [Bartonella fuyuanensis]